MFGDIGHNGLTIFLIVCNLMEWETCTFLAEKRGLHTHMKRKGFVFHMALFVACTTLKVYGINGMEGAI